MNFSNEQYSMILPARIVEYFPADQTATVLICTDRIAHSADSTDNLEARTPIQGVPVHTPSGGGWSMTMPIAAGDTCLMLFSQTGYDHWLYADEDVAGVLNGMPKPHLLRKFKEDDGFCFVGINTIPRAISDYSATAAQLRGPVAANQVISLNADASINIDSSVSVTINAPSVVINCDDAEVNATATATVTAPTTDVIATTAVSITSPATSISGTLTVNGIATLGGIAVTGGAAADMGSGALTSSGSITVNGIDLETHTHTITGGSSAGETSTAN